MSQSLPWSLGLRNGPNARFRAASLAPPFPSNPTAPCAALLTGHSTRKHADPSVMGPCVSCMLGALPMVAAARYGTSVKNIPPPKHRVVSVRCFGLFPLILSCFLLFPLLHLLPLCLRLLPCGFARLAASPVASTLAPAHAPPNRDVLLGACSLARAFLRGGEHLDDSRAARSLPPLLVTALGTQCTSRSCPQALCSLTRPP